MTRSQVLSLQELGESFSQLEVSVIAIATFFVALQFLFHILRFYCLFPKRFKLPFAKFSLVVLIGQIVNHFLPARTGDVYKVFAIKKQAPSPELTTAFTTSALLAEKFYTITSLIVFAAFSITTTRIVLFPKSMDIGRLNTPLTWGITLGLGILFAVVIYRSQKVQAWFENLFHSFKTVLRPKRIVYGFVLAFLSWVAEVYSLSYLAATFSSTLTFSDCVLAITVLNLGIAIPITFASLGAYEAGLVFVLTRSGMDLEPALTIALTHHIIQILTVFLLTGLFKFSNFSFYSKSVSVS